MSLFPEEDVLTKEIQSWKGFADSLPAEEDRMNRRLEILSALFPLSVRV